MAYPIKEAFAKATGLDLLDFNTNQARIIFKKLGFEVERLKLQREAAARMDALLS